LLADLSAPLHEEYGPGFSVNNLKHFRNFYRIYPQLLGSPIWHAARAKLNKQSTPDHIAKQHTKNWGKPGYRRFYTRRVEDHCRSWPTLATQRVANLGSPAGFTPTCRGADHAGFRQSTEVVMCRGSIPSIGVVFTR
jgi:hypothetical protein